MYGPQGAIIGKIIHRPMIAMPVQDGPDIKKMDRSDSRSTPKREHAEEGDRESKSQTIRQGEQEEELDEFQREEHEERREARRFRQEGD